MADGEDSMAVTLRRRRFTLDEYHRMGETGILGPPDRVELIEGEIIEMAPIGSRHAGTVARIQHVFSTRLGDRAVVWSQNRFCSSITSQSPNRTSCCWHRGPIFISPACRSPLLCDC